MKFNIQSSRENEMKLNLILKFKLLLHHIYRSKRFSCYGVGVKLIIRL